MAKTKPKAKQKAKKEPTQDEIDAAFIANGGMPKAQPEKPKSNAGRPSGYHDIDLEVVKKLALEGWTDYKFSKFFEIDEATWYRWKAKYPELCESLKVSGAIPDANVELSLFKRASGYTAKEQKAIFNPSLGCVEIIEVEKVYPPDPTSMIFWLKNRQKDRWREQQKDETLQPQDIGKSLETIANAIINRDG